MNAGAAALCLALLFSSGGGDVEAREIKREEVQVPILFLHHIDEDVRSETIISPEKFEELSVFLDEEGYETVGFEDLVAYVDEGEPLPKKPVIITFDDGYESNLTYAAPILRERGQRATVFVIGVSVGKDQYRDTEIPIIPHFSWEAARQWTDVITFASHTYDMHQSEYTDGPDYRRGVLPKDGENEKLHYSLFLSDVRRSILEMDLGLKMKPLAFSYPYGMYSAETEQILKDAGIRASVITSYGPNPVVKGDPGSLYHLHRFEVFEDSKLSDIKRYLDTGIYVPPDGPEQEEPPMPTPSEDEGLPAQPSADGPQEPKEQLP